MSESIRQPWSEAQDTLVKTKWAIGLSAQEIADDLAATGVIRSRSSIIARMDRLGVPKRDDQVRYNNQVRAKQRNAIPKAKTAKPPKPGRQYRPGLVFGEVNILDPQATERAIQSAHKAGKTIEARVAEGCGVASPSARPFMEVPSGACRWPLGETPNLMACCNPVAVEGKPYCAGHAAVAYVGKVTTRTMGAVVQTSNKYDRIDMTVRRPAKPAPTEWDSARAAA